MSAHPDLVGPTGGRQRRQAIGRDGLVMFAVGGDHAIAPFLPAADLFLAHETAQAIAAVALAGGAQSGLDARSAIGLVAFLVQAPDLFFEALIFLGARAGLLLAAGPVVVAAGGDLK